LANVVLELRQRELAKTTKPFNARGSKVIRCDGCLLPKADCLCAYIPSPSARSAVLLLMYTGECYKPSNTGRLIADVAADSYAFVWDRTQPDPALLQLLQREDLTPVVVFPHEYASAERCISTIPQELQTGSKKPLFIMLDGTWREAKKMFSKSPYLDQFPVLGINPTVASGYKLREAAHLHQLCTAEVGIEVLKLAGDEQAAADLNQYFQVFRRQYMAGKPHLEFDESSV
jgi:hypothetical protein